MLSVRRCLIADDEPRVDQRRNDARADADYRFAGAVSQLRRFVPADLLFCAGVGAERVSVSPDGRLGERVIFFVQSRCFCENFAENVLRLLKNGEKTKKRKDRRSLPYMRYKGMSVR